MNPKAKSEIPESQRFRLKDMKDCIIIMKSQMSGCIKEHT